MTNKESSLDVIRSLIKVYGITLSDIFPDAADDLKILEALRQHGVDNWEFFDDAIDSIDG